MKKNHINTNVTIKGEGRDEVGNRYFQFSISGSDVSIPPVAVAQIISDPQQLFVKLANAGVNLFTPEFKNGLLKQLQDRKPEPEKFKVATQLGWKGRRAYVLPERVIGRTTLPVEPVFNGLDAQMLAKYRTKGTLEEWQQQIASPCNGNSRLMFAVSLACTGPVLSLVNGPRGGGFQFPGDPETGKTMAAMVAGSFWGCHVGGRSEHGFIENWHTTSGKVEPTALAHNDTLLILDETKRAGDTDQERARVVLDASFNLAEGTEKERLTNTAGSRSWRLYFLSTSNCTVSELAERGGLDVDDAILGRIFDIPCPFGGFGIFEQLHAFSSGEKLTNALKSRCRRFFGVAAAEFIAKLVGQCAADAAKVKGFLANEQRAYLIVLNAKLKEHGLKALNRVSGRCAIVFAAGSLAIKFKILPWDRDALLYAILNCQLDGIRIAQRPTSAVRGSKGDLRAKLVAHLRENKASFYKLDKERPTRESHRLGEVPGYWDKFKDEKWYYLLADQLAAVIGTGAEAKRLKRQLLKEGLMASSNRGFVVQRPIFQGGAGNKDWSWVCAFKADLIAPTGN
jgi:putative DNA primase/helicase